MPITPHHPLTILHVNDTEGEPSNVWPRLATTIAQARAFGHCDLLLHAGDLALETDTPGEVIQFVASLGFDVLALGNHDLTSSNHILQSHLSALETTVVCANVYGLPEPQVQPYRRFDIKGWRVIVIGITLGDLPRFVTPQRMDGITVLPAAQVLAELVPHLRPQADLLIVLSHAGLGCDQELPLLVPGIDLVIGGHDHAVMPQPLEVGDGWVTQAGADGAYVGRLTVTRHGERVQVTGDLLPMKNIVVDPVLRDRLRQLDRSETEDEIVGYTTTSLCTPGVDVRSPAYWRETPLGNLMVDLIRDAAATDLAFLRCASVRNALPCGPIKRKELRQMSWDSDDQIAQLVLTGNEIYEVLESAAREPYRLLLMSGARVTYDATKPLGQRIVSVLVGDTKLIPGKMYTVACSYVLANGVGDYPILATKPRNVVAMTIGEIFANHIHAVETISPALDGRLEIIGQL